MRWIGKSLDFVIDYMVLPFLVGMVTTMLGETNGMPRRYFNTEERNKTCDVKECTREALVAIQETEDWVLYCLAHGED